LGLLTKLREKLKTNEPPQWYKEAEERRRREYQELFTEISKVRDKIEDIYKILGVHSAEISNLKRTTENYGEVLERLNFLEREIYELENKLKNLSTPEKRDQPLDEQIIALLSKKPMTYSELRERLYVSDRRLSKTLKELTDLSILEKSRKVFFPITVFERDPLSIVLLAPTSTPSSNITFPICGVLVFLFLLGIKPKPFTPIFDPSWI